MREQKRELQYRHNNRLCVQFGKVLCRKRRK